MSGSVLARYILIYNGGMRLLIKAILRLVVYAGALLLIANIVHGITVTNFSTALLFALLWGGIGLTIRPVLLLLTLPINLLTFGLFTFIINALLFWLAALLAPGISVAGFIPALEGSVLLTLVSWALHAVL